MGTLAIGSVLAAIGTALPESVVTVVAVTLGHGAQSKQIGVGAAMDGPLVLATTAYGVTGWMLLTRKRTLVPQTVAAIPPEVGAGHAESTDVDPFAGVDLHRLASDQRWFLSIFADKVSLGLPGRPGALLRPAPLRTGLARFPRIRLKQASDLRG
jgi:cation:H+ antiporter